MSPLVPGRNLVLIGLMGTGKSTVGRLLAARLGRPFADTDGLVEAERGMTVAALFAAEGERAFRAVEAEVIRHVSALRGQVIAVGGGAVLDAANVRHLKATGDVALLDAEPAALAARVSAEAGARPLLEGAEDVAARLAALRDERREAYLRAADTVVDAGMAPEAVAEAVLTWARQRPGLLAAEEVPA